jgi:hypothetical protein
MLSELLKKVFSTFSSPKISGGFSLPKPLWVEPTFTLYYPDMVYSNPLIAEIDLLLIYEGGFVCVELKRKASDVAADSFKFFVNGLAPQPVFYVYSEASHLSLHYMKPFTASWDQLRDLVGDMLRVDEQAIRERERLFSLDNFLRILLIFGSPGISDAVSHVKFLKVLSEASPLVKKRFLQIKAVRGMKLDKKISEQRPLREGAEPVSKKTGNVDRFVAVIPTIRNKHLLKKIAGALKEYVSQSSSEDLTDKGVETTLLCTKKSEEDAKMLTKELEGGRITVRIVPVEESTAEDLEDAWVKKLRENCRDNCVVLFVGEVPKGVITKIAELAEGLKVAVVMWRPRIDIEKMKTILREGGDMPIEEVRLDVVEY